MTYVATASAVINNGCKLRIADVNIENASIDQKEVIKKINSNTRAIIIVNLWGFSANYKNLKNLCEKKNIILIEDAAQSIGSVNSEGVNSGNIGHISLVLVFRKKFRAYGDGGAVVTNNKKIYEKILKLRTHGATEKFKHELVGINSRLHSMQAVVLNQKLKRISLINNKKEKLLIIISKILIIKIKLFKISRILASINLLYL